jgi:hypothetical protein
MKSTGKNHPWERIFASRDEINIAEGPAFLELPLGEILNPTTFRIDPKGKQNWQHWRNNG